MKYLLPFFILSFFLFAVPAQAEELTSAQQLEATQAELDKVTAEAEAGAKEYEAAAAKVAAEAQAMAAKFSDPSKMTPEEAQELGVRQTELAAKASAEAQAYSVRQMKLQAKIMDLTAQIAELSQKLAAEQSAQE